jgi:thioredoxin reductase
MEKWDAIVVGGGSAGLACALTLTRAVRRTLVIDGGRQRNRSAPHSHGVLGFDGTSPAHLLELGREEIARFGGRVATDTVVGAERTDGGFVLATEDGREHRTRQLILATGVTDELPAVPGVAELWGRRVVICPYCDGWEARDSRVGILGTGAKSILQAQLLRQWSADVVVFTDGRVPLSDADSAALDARGIVVVDQGVTGIEESETGSLLVGTGTGRWERDIVFTAPRAVANDSLLRELGVGGGAALEPTGATGVPGLWAVGNVVDPTLKVQAAAGHGMTVGTHVNEALVLADIAAALADRNAAGRGIPSN